MVFLRISDIGLGNVLNLDLLLTFAHLIPLEEHTVFRVHLSERLHGQIEYQLKMRDMTGDGFSS